MLTDQLTGLIIDELHRQARISGCQTAHSGSLVQVDGSFDAHQLAVALVREFDCVARAGGAANIPSSS